MRALHGDRVAFQDLVSVFLKHGVAGWVSHGDAVGERSEDC
jgi:hypothetical protein